MGPSRIHVERDESLARLVRLIASEKNMHHLVSRVASDVRLLKSARRAFMAAGKGGAYVERFTEFCRTCDVSPEVFGERLKILVYILGLVEHGEGHYRALGLNHDANPEEIKSAFRRLSLLNHPDRNPGDAQAADRFREIRYAYQILGDEKLRRHYDHHLTNHNWAQELAEEEKGRPASFWRRLGRSWQLGLLIALLVVLSILVDYQRLLSVRYYQTKQPEAPETESSAGRASPHGGVALDGHQPGASKDMTDTIAGRLSRESAHGSVVDAFVRKSSADSIQDGENGPKVLDAFMRSKVDGTAPSTGADGGGYRHFADALPGTSVTTRSHAFPAWPDILPNPVGDVPPEGRSIGPDGDLGGRIDSFLSRYSVAYEQKHLAGLLDLYEPDALENGRPIADLVPLYLDNFHRVHRFRCGIDLNEWVASEDGVRVDGVMHVAIQFSDDLPIEVSGAVSFHLAPHGRDFRIRRLFYNLGGMD